MSSLVDPLIRAAIHDGVFPGACYAVSHRGRLLQRPHGRITYCPESTKVALDTIWDLASLTKVVGTTTAAMILFDEGKLKLDQPVVEVVPEFAGSPPGSADLRSAEARSPSPKEKVTIRNLLVHDSGLAAFRPYHRKHKTREEALQAIWDEALEYPTGTKTVYSDLGIVTLGVVLERLAGMPLDRLIAERVCKPLGMAHTLFNPPPELTPKCAPTESVEPWRLDLRKLRYGYLAITEMAKVRVDGPTHPDAAHWIQGEVHDPTAMVLGGVAGHAGLFSTVGDLCRFMAMMMDRGRSLIRPETVETWTKRQGPASTRALGWDTPSVTGSSAGTLFSKRSFGHTGYTGTSIWADPERELFAILLTNRVHPTSENTKIIQFRPKFHDAVVRAVGAGQSAATRCPFGRRPR